MDEELKELFGSLTELQRLLIFRTVYFDSIVGHSVDSVFISYQKYKLN